MEYNVEKARTHPRRPRGSQSGREKRREQSEHCFCILLHFAPTGDSRTEQVSFYLYFNFHLQFTNKSKGFPMVIYEKRLGNIFHTQQTPAAAVLHISVDFFDKLF